MPTPDERSAIELRIAQLTARMKELDHLRRPENIAEWGALYEVRDTLEKSLDED